LILALLVAHRQKQAIQSSGLKRTVAKTALYLAGLVLAFVTESYLTGPVVPCVHIVTGLVGITELKSCLEHLDVLNGAPVFAAVLSKLAPASYDPNKPEGE
jgi:hypothetical protein